VTKKLRGPASFIGGGNPLRTLPLLALRAQGCALPYLRPTIRVLAVAQKAGAEGSPSSRYIGGLTGRVRSGSYVRLVSGHSSCEVVICGRSRPSPHGGADASPRFRPNSGCRCERGFLREHGHSTLCDRSAVTFALVSLDVAK
jgi:hypothetical protein